MSTTARQRPQRAFPFATSNGSDKPLKQSLTSTQTVGTGGSTAVGLHRMNRSIRRKRLSSSVIITAVTSVVLILFCFVLVRRILVVVSLQGDNTPIFSLVRQQHVGTSQYTNDDDSRQQRRILTAFLEPLGTLNADRHPLPPRNTSASILTQVQFPRVARCSQLMETWPVDDFPSDDPFLPWIHDVFPTHDGRHIQFVAQNKRRCHVGENKQEEMKHWEPQIALFQPIPVVQQQDGHYRLYSSSPTTKEQQATTTWNETRFLCRFHTAVGKEYNTMSKFPFNYEYVSWRKNEHTMYKKSGKDNMQFWLSQLLFSCPVPDDLRSTIQSGSHVGINDDESTLWVDLVPIRTPPRYGRPLFTTDHVGRDLLQTMSVFDTEQEWGDQHILPAVHDSGRWANIPICLPPPSSSSPSLLREPPRHRLVACTWTAAVYTRRGDAVTMDDTARRLREWILFHKMVGFERIHVYDNTVVADNSTSTSKSPLEDICDEFDFVEHHKWPATVCNNNRPNHPNPGERSSQYAAEASCRERYGPTSDWMAFIDTDEYLVPMKSETWNDLLDSMDKDGIKILKMRSSRSLPRLDLMETQEDQTPCVDPSSRKSRFEPEPCVVPRRNETFLRTYNCEFIKPPRPDRFQRAMKQIFRPSHVVSHFVHYSTVTADVAPLHKDYGPTERYDASVHGMAWQSSSPEVFLDELNEGTLVHTKSVLPHETMYRSNVCRFNSSFGCSLGFVCPAHVEFSDELHKKNLFQDDSGNYCNCWTNPRVEEMFAPKLKLALQEHERHAREGS